MLISTVLVVSSITAEAHLQFSSLSGFDHAKYVTNGQSSNQVVATISVGTAPESLVYDSTNKLVYAVNTVDNSVSVINGSTNSVIATIAVAAEPHGIVFDPNNNRLYVGGLSAISVIDGSTNSVVATITRGIFAVEGVAFDSANGYIYATSAGEYNKSTSGIAVINPSSNSIVQNITAAGYGLTSITYLPTWNLLFANNVNGYIVVIDARTNTVKTTIDINGYLSGLTFDSVNNYVYVNDFGNNNTLVINPSTGSQVTTIPVSVPSGIAFDSVNQDLYVTGQFANEVYVINTATNKIVSTITVGNSPYGALFDPANSDIYISNSVDGRVSVISGGA